MTMSSKMKWHLALIFPVGPLAILLLFVNACTSSEKQVKIIDTSLEEHGSADIGKIGLNSDEEAIIQEERSAADELRMQQWINLRLLDDLESEHHELARCREDLADPRLGGDSQIREIPDLDNMKTVGQVKEEFGLNQDGQLKFVKKQDYLDRLSLERKYETSLREMHKTVSKHRIDCERRMGYVRIQHGLPSQRYAAKGFFDREGTWVTERGAERNLDDAFEILRKQQREAKNSPKTSEPVESSAPESQFDGDQTH